MLRTPRSLAALIRTHERIWRMREPWLRIVRDYYHIQQAAITMASIATVSYQFGSLSLDIVERTQLIQRIHPIIWDLDKLLGPVWTWLRKSPVARAQEAALEGDRDTVARFVRDWLRLRPTTETIEAVEMVLLEGEWVHLHPEDVLPYIRRQTARQLRAQRFLGEIKLRGQRIDYLDRQIQAKDGRLTLLELVEAPDPTLSVIDRLYVEDLMRSLRFWFTDQELRVIWRYSHGWTWSEAAQAEGLPHEHGDRIRKKLARLTLRR